MTQENFKIPVRDCHMLREGAPVPPEPPIGAWKPETYVCNNFKN